MTCFPNAHLNLLLLLLLLLLLKMNFQSMKLLHHLRPPTTLPSSPPCLAAAPPFLPARSHLNKSSHFRAVMPDFTSADRQKLFNRIAPAYDNLNDWLSLGQHRIWKRMAVKWSRAKPGDVVLDICCGSGDLSFLLSEKVGPKGKVTGLDFAEEQLIVAAERERSKAWPCYGNLEWLQGDALDLPFGDEAFDAVTVGYGLRNITNIPRALNEMFRVVKKGSCVAILDFNKPSDTLVYGIQNWLLDNLVVPVAAQFGMREEYAYLKDSIACFPTGKEQEKLAKEAGFSVADHYELANGLMGVLVLRK